MGLFSTKAKSIDHVRRCIEIVPLKQGVINTEEINPADIATTAALEDTPFSHFSLRGLVMVAKTIKGESADIVKSETVGAVYADDVQHRDDYPLAVVFVPLKDTESTALVRPAFRQMQTVALADVSYEILENSDDESALCLEAAARGTHVVANALYDEEYEKVRRLIEPRAGLIN